MVYPRIVIYSRDVAADGLGKNPTNEFDVATPFVELVQGWDDLARVVGVWFYRDAQFPFEDQQDEIVPEAPGFHPEDCIEYFTLVWDYLGSGTLERQEAIEDSREVFDWLCANSDYDWALSYQGVPGRDLFRPSARTKEPFPDVVDPVLLPSAT